MMSVDKKRSIVPTAYSYIRFSTPEQKKGDSLRRQMALSEKYAADHGLTLDTSLNLHDLGVSAFDRSNIERGELGAFLTAVEEGYVAAGSYLLVESLDRLSRDKVRAALTLFMSILEKGITIVTLADGRVYDPGKQDVSDLIISITIMARAHDESLMKSHRIRAAWSNKRELISEKKLTAQCPKWMRLSDDKCTFEFIPDRVEIVREIVRSAKNGMGQSQIAKILNARSVPPFSNHGNGWHSSYIQKILTSPALYGEFQPAVFEGGKAVPHGDPVVDYYPALISKQDFYFLQSLRSQNAFGGGKARKGADVPNLLSGVVKCGYCNSTMVLAGAAAKRVKNDDGSETKRPSKKVLVCDGARRGLGCYAVQWGYKEFETSFLSFCRGLELGQILAVAEPAKAKDRALSIEEQLQAVKAEIEENRHQSKNLTDAIAVGKAPAVILDRIRILEDELDRLNESEKKLDAELNIIADAKRDFELAGETIRDLISRMESLDGEALFAVRVALAAQIRRVIEVVKVYPAGSLKTPEQIERIRAGLIESGFDEASIESHMLTYQTSPRKQGRGGRGRYASRRDIDRHFLIQTKKGGYSVVSPTFDDPSVAVIELGTWD